MFRTRGKAEPVTDKTRQEAPAVHEEPLLQAGRRSTDEGTLDTRLARGSEVNGKLHFEGTVRIDGPFTGEITTNDLLIIGEGAKIAANISCGSVVVNGEVTGNITATDSVELHRPARVKGDIATPSLTIDKGVVFDGSSKMENGGMNVGSLIRRDGAKRSGLGV